ncbi:MAG: hypothetical protein XD92_0597 [Proteiniphilum acetatigenes]|uniref:Thioredoxin domain-containing protein n=1 Tax=Proteiniphilum acetatigenes TaxID=294710 RepID=A0A124FXG8_9BACT|nr:MAG: hypothetical protein XD92_0597 [Proteiniphilum acetatigenes]
MTVAFHSEPWNLSASFFRCPQHYLLPLYPEINQLNKNKNEVLKNQYSGNRNCSRIAVEELEEERPEVKFYSMAFDSPESGVIRNAPECRGFMGLPFTMYYKNGKVAKATTSIQTMAQVEENLNQYLS